MSSQNQPEVKLLSAGQSFDEAIAPLYAKIVRILSRIYENHQDKDDLVQEGIITLWKWWQLDTQLFEEKSIAYLVGMAKRGQGGRYLDVWNGRDKFDAGNFDDPDNIQKMQGGHGREVHLADIRLDIGQAARIIHHRYQTMHNTQFNAKKRAQLDIIFRDFIDGRPTAETAEQLNMKATSIRGWHTDFRVQFRELLPDYDNTRLRPHYTPEEVTRLLTLVMEGFTYRQIARQLDRPIDSVSSKYYEIRNLEQAGD
jgi:hypothetical protein